jgi:hypothetical protein
MLALHLVEERVRRKGRDILQPKTGSAIPMAVSFRDFDPTDSYIWLELYSAPSEKDIEIIGSVVRSWYVLGRLGGFNSMNMQLTQLPLNAKLSYSPEKAEEALPSVFHNIGDVEFQEHWARVWYVLVTFVFVYSVFPLRSLTAKEISFSPILRSRWLGACIMA